MKATQLFLFALLVSAVPAHAELTASGDSASTDVALKSKAKKKKTKKKDSTEAILDEKTQDVSLPMAHGELQAEVAADVAQRERADAPRTHVELGASSWTPTRVTTGSRIPGTSDFATKGLPEISASLFSPIAGRQLHLEFGLGLLAMERTGTIRTSGISVPQAQNGYIGTVRVGVAYSPWLLFADRVIPYVSAAALPSMLVTRASSFDDGVNDTGVPYEVGAGTLVRLSRPLAIDVGVHQVMGRVQDSDFKGFGVRAGVRVAI